MMEFALTAGCKVNLYLDIVGIRPDGYHEIESLFYPLPAPCDTLLVREGENGFSLSCSDPSLATDANIVSRAYRLFAETTGFAPDVSVHIQKRIPMGAGLGGGSSDAAAFLLWLNGRAGEKALAAGELAGVALSLGADVPFFLVNQPAWITGIGERIEPVLCDPGDTLILLICPPLRVDTGWAYGRWDAAHAGGPCSRKKLTPHPPLTRKFCFTNPSALWNTFENVVFQEFPLLQDIKSDVMRHGAKGCVMSGTGSTLVAFFDAPEDALSCARRLHAAECVCHAVKSGREFSLES